MFLLGIQDDGIDAIARGEILKGRVRRMGEMRWQELDDHPLFAEALRRAADTSSGRFVITMSQKAWTTK